MVKEFKYFVLTEYEEEELYLREKHKQGYKLIHVSAPGIYEFVSCTPEDVVYRLDFNPQNKEDKATYIQMFTDYGWEYIQDMNEYSYFRKKVDKINEDENHIFCDNESKMDMLKRIIQRRFLPLIVIFLCCFMPQFTNLLHHESPLAYGFLVFFIILSVLLVYLMARIMGGYNRLKKKYEDEVK